MQGQIAYLLGHNGLGDNITSLGALNFLLKYYETIYFICKNIYYDNMRALITASNVVIIPFDAPICTTRTDGTIKYDLFKEFRLCYDIILNKVSPSDVYVCGMHKRYIQPIRMHPELVNLHPSDGNYSPYIAFIADFYKDFGLGLSAYYDCFDVPEIPSAVYRYSAIQEYNIFFLHTKASNMELDAHQVTDPFCTDETVLMICANKNVYPKNHHKYRLAESFVNLLLVEYIPIIKNSFKIYVINSCFSCIVHPLSVTKRLKTNDITIVDR